ncbi:TetR/AcrR family transcriptional regulator [Nocardia jiangxiensis]|uniref:TetR/AcrR family transcriptional regulator n=1 Tax=Nocardia jiangxiensis TaxID=282685 RepID=A0ABW6SFC3_9NOCA|nr:TetR/AcrR family transcriptional regulator [Nocardia jiangxiensis]
MTRTETGGRGEGRARSPRGRGEELRTEILAAVNRLLAEWGGVEKLTMRAVATEVGTTAASIYLHFADKTELVWAALSDKYTELAARMADADVGAVSDGPRARLRAAAHAYCRFGLDNPGHYRLMYEVRQPEVDASRIGRHPSRLISENFRKAFVRCREAGHGLALPIEQSAQTLWQGLHGELSLSHSLFSGASTEALMLALADGLLDALVSAAPDSSERWPSPSDSPASQQLRSILIRDTGHSNS